MLFNIFLHHYSIEIFLYFGLFHFFLELDDILEIKVVLFAISHAFPPWILGIRVFGEIALPVLSVPI